MVYTGNITLIWIKRLWYFRINYTFLSDEHIDFKEEIERLKKLRGKGKRERKPRTEEPAKQAKK